MTDKARIVDLFCGAGGLSLGFERAGAEVVFAADHNAAAVETHRHNLGGSCSDLEISERTELPPADLIVGGPPCQGFSSAGARRTDDKRNTLVRTFAELIVAHRPLAFVFENVEGFLTAQAGERVLDLLEPVVGAGYQVHLRKINAANFGVPQHRKRVLAIGGLGWEPRFPEPTHRAYGAPGAGSIGHGRLPQTPSLKDALEGLPRAADVPPGVPEDHYFRELNERVLASARLLKQGQTMRDLPEECWHESYRRRAYRRVMDGTPSERRGGAPAGLRRLAFDQPSKAITSGARSDFLHPTEDRYLTIRECARIQTFPDSFLFLGSAADRALQIGNAVPPRLAEVIAAELLSGLPERRPRRLGEGQLLSFVPTVANGMSPILQKVTTMVEDRFNCHNPEQATLWD
jgi:DNA (cytosine-5)-methyltransferase 1